MANSKTRLTKEETALLNQLSVKVTKEFDIDEAKEQCLVAIAEVIVSGIIKIRGFKIMYSIKDTGNYFVQPPSVRSGSRWYDIVFVDSRGIWRLLEKDIIREFLGNNAEDFVENEIPM